MFALKAGNFYKHFVDISEDKDNKDISFFRFGNKKGQFGIVIKQPTLKITDFKLQIFIKANKNGYQQNWTQG